MVKKGMTQTRITVAHSPDSDDAFMFFGLASGNVETHGIVVDQVLSDIETLNRAVEGRYKSRGVVSRLRHLGTIRAVGTGRRATITPERRCATGRPARCRQRQPYAIPHVDTAYLG